MYSSGCGRRGPSVPRRYYALLLATADFSTVRSTVRKNINYKDYPKQLVEEILSKRITQTKESTHVGWCNEKYIKCTCKRPELFQVDHVVTKIACIKKIIMIYFHITIGILQCVSLLFHQFFVIKLRGLVVLDSVQVWRPHLPLSNSSFNPGSQNLGNIAAPPMMRIFYQLF